MKAYAYVEKIGIDALRVVTRPDPDPGPHDIVLRMRAIALNHRDLAIAKGQYHVTVTPPLVPISDGAGEVIAVGSQVSRFRPGDLVCPTYMPDWVDGPVTREVAGRRLGGPSDGVMSEYLCIHENEAVRAPRHLCAEEAATLPVSAVTAWHSLFCHGAIKPGDVVMVQGSGGVSTAAVQFATAAGAKVISVIRSSRHAHRLQTIGAQRIVFSSAEDWPLEVIRAADGRGADLVVDVVGSTLAQSIAAAKVGGLIHLVGYVGSTRAHLDIFDAIRHATTLKLATAGPRTSFEAMVRAMELHSIRPPEPETLPITRWREGFDLLSTGGHFGKIVLTL